MITCNLSLVRNGFIILLRLLLSPSPYNRCPSSKKRIIPYCSASVSRFASRVPLSATVCSPFNKASMSISTIRRPCNALYRPAEIALNNAMTSAVLLVPAFPIIATLLCPFNARIVAICSNLLLSTSISSFMFFFSVSSLIGAPPVFSIR